jgi:hypothetical protein
MRKLRTVGSWHSSNSDSVHRQRMLTTLHAWLQQHSGCSTRSSSSSGGNSNVFDTLAQYMEDCLYRSASSQAVYSDAATERKRIQWVAEQFYATLDQYSNTAGTAATAAAAAVSSEACGSSAKRKRGATTATASKRSSAAATTSTSATAATSESGRSATAKRRYTLHSSSKHSCNTSDDSDSDIDDSNRDSSASAEANIAASCSAVATAADSDGDDIDDMLIEELDEEQYCADNAAPAAAAPAAAAGSADAETDAAALNDDTDTDDALVNNRSSGDAINHQADAAVDYDGDDDDGHAAVTGMATMTAAAGAATAEVAAAAAAAAARDSDAERAMPTAHAGVAAAGAEADPPALVAQALQQRSILAEPVVAQAQTQAAPSCTAACGSQHTAAASSAAVQSDAHSSMRVETLAQGKHWYCSLLISTSRSWAYGSFYDCCCTICTRYTFHRASYRSIV